MIFKQEKALGSSNSLFGTSGIRGIVGRDLPLDLCGEVGQAIGTMLAPYSKVCVATDTRVSRETVKGAVVSGLRSSGTNVTDLGILPTPALSLLTRDMGFEMGVMITASHNPPEFNGIKLFNRNSIGYSKAQEAEMQKIYGEERFRTGYLGTYGQNPEAKERYFQFMLDKFPNQVLNENSRIIVDPGNGAASGFASKLLDRAGFEVIPVNDEPNGLFLGRSPEPKEDTLQGTIEFLRQQDGDLAVCFDGDADRVVFCDKEGFLGFDELIAFVSRLAVESSGKKRVVTTVEAGKLLDLALSDLGVEVIRGKVGDVSVAYLTRELDAAIGVEPVGVYIMPEVGYYPDSMFAALTLLSRIRKVSEIREFFRGIPQLFYDKRKVPCPNSLKTVTIEKIEENVAFFGANQINTLDGLRLEFGDSWMLIRASGTEPAVRVIAESTSRSETEMLLSKGVQAIDNILEGLTI